MNWKVLAGGLVLVAPLVWVLAAGFGHDPRELPSTMEGRPAPSFQLTTIDGQQRVSLQDLRGKVVVLNFWATWCSPCAVEHAGLQAVARKLESRGVVFLGMLYGDEPAAAQAYLQKRGSTYTQLDDPGQKVAIDYGVAGVPETFLIGRDGQIAHKIVGPVREADLIALLEPLL